MDGENNGKPYFLMDDLGVKPPLFLETPISGSPFLLLEMLEKVSSWLLTVFLVVGRVDPTHVEMQKKKKKLPSIAGS